MSYPLTLRERALWSMYEPDNVAVGPHELRRLDRLLDWMADNAGLMAEAMNPRNTMASNYVDADRSASADQIRYMVKVLR